MFKVPRLRVGTPVWAQECNTELSTVYQLALRMPVRIVYGDVVGHHPTLPGVYNVRQRGTDRTYPCMNVTEYRLGGDRAR